MNKKKVISCAFCRGTGKNPHFTGTCPTCKGKGKIAVVGPFMTCKDCRGSGQKRGTTLVCWTCGGLGVVPDTREEFKKARKEIKKARKEIENVREEFEKPDPVLSGQNTRFCQCCAKKVEKSSTLKVCLECFKKIKEL